MKDYYKILGVDKNASDEDIKKAFRKLAHQHHPDKGGGDEAKFKEANEAYQVLSNKEKRAQYDRFGTADPFGSSAGGGPAGGWQNMNWEDPGSWAGAGFPGGVDMGDLGDIFDLFTGGGRGTRTVSHGSDLELLEEITLEDAFRGVTKPVTIATWIGCGVCKGEGGDPGAGTETCSVCGGQGQVREERRTFFGSFAQVKTCARCQGRGSLPKKPCENCKGKGRVQGERSTTLEILPGIQDGQLIQLKGFGEAGERGTQAGDLYVRVRVKPHAKFARQADDLVVRHELKVKDILLGKPVLVPTIEGGQAEFEVPAGFDLKQPYRIPGKGMPRFGSRPGRAGSRGDLLVDFIIKAPKKLAEKERKVLEEGD